MTIYKPDKKTKIKGMRKVKHLSKAQVDVLVIMWEGDGLSVWNDNGKLEPWLEDGDKNVYSVQMQTIKALERQGMIESYLGRHMEEVLYRRTEAADEYIVKYHRERVKDFIS